MNYFTSGSDVMHMHQQFIQQRDPVEEERKERNGAAAARNLQEGETEPVHRTTARHCKTKHD